MKTRRAVEIGFLLVITASIAGAAWAGPQTGEQEIYPLSRRATFGAVLLSRADKQPGVQLGDLIPGGPAEKAGFAKGDVLTLFDGAIVETPMQIVTMLKQYGAYGAELVVPVDVTRGGAKIEKEVRLTPLPQESAPDFDILYGTFAAKESRLRSIVTRPRVTGRQPAVLFLQGFSCTSYDLPYGDSAHVKEFLYGLTRAGYVTMRAEKFGVGDSDGPACTDIDYQTEVTGFEQALRTLKKLDFVDPNRIFLFGHSMGGTIGPIIANRAGGVRGIIVYGTTARTWIEYDLENMRRQEALDATDPLEIDKDMRLDERFSFEAYVNHHDAKALLAIDPKFADLISPDNKRFGRNNTFLQGLNDADLAKEWEQYTGDALALWGKSDFITSALDHEALVDAVNHAHPGHATFLELDGIDHLLDKASSQQDSFEQIKSGKFGDFNSVLAETVKAWLDQRAKSATN